MLLLTLAAGVGESMQDAQPTPGCAWPAAEPSSGTLAREAEFAEDLAIRYADACCAPHSGHFESMAEYRRKRDQCMTALFQTVARNHGVTVEQVRQSLSDRPKLFDLGVITSFAVLYGLAAFLISDLRRGIIMTAYVSVITSVVGMLVLTDLWAATMENLRIGNGHLSYRGARIPWQHHRLEIVVIGILVFWAVAALRSRAEFRPRRSG